MRFPQRLIETAVGLLVLVLAAVALIWGVGQRGTPGHGSYDLYADFSDASGIAPGTLVEIAGVPVGQVVAVDLTDTYDARVQLRINAGVQIPAEAELAWRQSDLIGAPRLAVLIFDLGNDVLEPGDFFAATDPADNFFEVLSDLAAGNAIYD